MKIYALRWLLASTVLVTAPLCAADVATDADQDTGVIVVTGSRPVTESSAGTKSTVPLAETPQSISVISASDIAGLGLQNLNQTLRFVAGVTPEQRGASEEIYDLFKLRGFDALIYLDGLRQFTSPTGYASAQTDISRLDRIEVVKGPASTLYGQSTPGGIIAQSSKLPLDRDLYGAASGTYGTFNLYRFDADVGGRAAPGVLWRLYGSANGADTQQKFGKRERQTISGAVTVGAGGKTSLTLLGNYSHDPYNGTYGVFPSLGTLIPNPNGRISSKFDGGEAGNRYAREQAAGTYIFTHQFNDNWAFRASGRLQRITSKLGLIYVSGGLDPDDTAQRLYSRASYSTRERLNAWTYDNQLTGRFDTGPITHNILIGYDRQLLHARELYAFGTAPSIDVYAPVYGTIAVPRTPAQVPNPFGGYYNVRSLQQGVYAQDELSWGGLRVTLSGREDWTRIANGLGTNAQDTVLPDAQKNRKFTWRAGALYKFDMGLAPYVSYATSFQPQTAIVANPDGTTGLAKPSTGKQLEAGAKYQVPGTAILVTAAWFRIIQNDVVTPNPLTNISFQSGKVRSTGVEVEATLPLPYGFNGRFAFSRQRVKVLEDADLARVGKSLETVGKGNMSANLEWSPKQGPLEGLALGGAVRHVSPVYAGIAPSDGIARYSPSYTVYDALVRYDLAGVSDRLNGLSVSINATNLFNKKYLTSCYANYGWCWYGSRRTVQGTIGYRF
ncbi:TonB-dependent siderophore receptor [Sphingomonas sp.]|uniref:TonB-dependent siderophore receptor n=1 Tax=Sphingomonas sp. TaxID=28214 RepID=UPI003B3BD079